MHKSSYSVIFLSLIFLVFSTAAQACKMTPLASSVTVMKAVLDTANENSGLQNRNLLAIRQGAAFSGVYIVETQGDDKGCQAIGYKATIEPTCQVNVQPLTTPFLCKALRKRG
jgi:hypothetical protein